MRCRPTLLMCRVRVAVRCARMPGDWRCSPGARASSKVSSCPGHQRRKERTEMNRRIILSVGGATAGLLTTTFLPATIALADNGVGAAGDVGSTAIPVGLTSGTAGTGGTAPLGDIGTLSPDVNAPEPGGLGALTPAAGTPDPTSSLPLGDTGGLSPVNGDGFTIGDTTFNPVQADGSEGSPRSARCSAPRHCSRSPKAISRSTSPAEAGPTPPTSATSPPARTSRTCSEVSTTRSSRSPTLIRPVAPRPRTFPPSARSMTS